MDETTTTRNSNGYGYPGARWQPEDLAKQTEWHCETCDQTFTSSEAEFTHDCARLGNSYSAPIAHATRRSDSVDAPERREGSGRGSSRPTSERTNRYPGDCVRCHHRVAAEAGLLVRDNSSQRAGTVWGVEHRRGECPETVVPEPEVRPQHRPNQYAGTCGTCLGHVAAEAGRLDRVDGRWVAYHLEGECPNIEHAAPQRAELADVPAGHYAVESSGHNDLAFYRVDRPTEGAYAGRVFVKLVVGGHPDLNVARSHVAGVLARIAADPDAAARYGQELGRCCRCNRTLTDETSRELGIGPECRSKL